MALIYLIGSLRNPDMPKISAALRLALPQHDFFDDWYAAGPIADDSWRDYEKARGHTFMQGLAGRAATNTFMFDFSWLLKADACVLILPAGKSGHLELGWMLGRDKPGYILLDNPDRWDVMYKFSSGVFDKLDPLVEALRRIK